MCAAPGGKTTAIGILMGNKGKVIATDRSHNKVSGMFLFGILYYECMTKVQNH